MLDCVTQCSQSAVHLCEQFLQVKQIGFVTFGPLRWGGCLELYYCHMVEWFWCDSSLISTTNWFPSVLWHCWFGHPTCKNRPGNDLLYVEWDVKPYTLTLTLRQLYSQVVMCAWMITWRWCASNCRRDAYNIVQVDNSGRWQTASQCTCTDSRPRRHRFTTCQWCHATVDRSVEWSHNAQWNRCLQQHSVMSTDSDNKCFSKKHILPYRQLLTPMIRPSLGLSPPNGKKTCPRRGQTQLPCKISCWSVKPWLRTPVTVHKKLKLKKAQYPALYYVWWNN